MSTLLNEANGSVVIRLLDGSEINLFELAKENTRFRGIVDLESDLSMIEGLSDKDVAYVLEIGELRVFIDNEWIRKGLALLTGDDIDNRIHQNEASKLKGGLSARVAVLKVEN